MNALKKLATHLKQKENMERNCARIFQLVLESDNTRMLSNDFVNPTSRLLGMKLEINPDKQPIVMPRSISSGPRKMLKIKSPKNVQTLFSTMILFTLYDMQ